MAVNKESLKGTYDRYPEEWKSYRKLLDLVRETAREHGFDEIEPPSIERQELWRQKAEDSVTDEMYAFEDKGNNKITLIPEQTPTRARMIQKRKDLRKPVKWYNTSKRWRYEDVTEGRDREFLQGDFDIFGVDSPEADAEVISTAARIFQKLGLEDRVRFQINNRKLLDSILTSQGIDKTEEAMQVIDDKEKMTEQEFKEELKSKDLSEEEASKIMELTDISGPLEQCLEELEDESPEEAEKHVNRLKTLAENLRAKGVLEMCKLDLSIVRGLAYYTGTVFEAFDRKREMRALFGGGRYDNLVGEYGDQEIPAVGFAFGYSPTVELLKKNGDWPLEENKTEVYVLAAAEEHFPEAAKIGSKLREKGIRTETPLKNRNFGEQLSYSNDRSSSYTVIVGDKIEQNTVEIKDMESGSQEEVQKDKLPQKISSKIEQRENE